MVHYDESYSFDSSILSILKNLLPQELLMQLQKTKKKADATGCYGYLKKQAKRTAGIKIINSGNRKIHPVQLSTIPFTLEKLNYIHNNSVKAGIVEKPEDYLLSSGRDYFGMRGLLPIEHLTAAYTLKS